MSLLPLIFRDMIRPLRMLEQQMRMAEDFFPTALYPMVHNQKNKYFIEVCDGDESITQDKEKFQVKLNVKNFTPDEIVVKTIDDNSIVIEAKHEKNNNEGSISRQFFRKFVIPKGHNVKKVESSLSADGILTVTAPNVGEKVQERIIPITHISNTEEKK